MLLWVGSIALTAFVMLMLLSACSIYTIIARDELESLRRKLSEAEEDNAYLQRRNESLSHRYDEACGAREALEKELPMLKIRYINAQSQSAAEKSPTVIDLGVKI
jgi:regulator of replication initiation timing